MMPLIFFWLVIAMALMGTWLVAWSRGHDAGYDLGYDDARREFDSPSRNAGEDTEIISFPGALVDRPIFRKGGR